MNSYKKISMIIEKSDFLLQILMVLLLFSKFLFIKAIDRVKYVLYLDVLFG